MTSFTSQHVHALLRDAGPGSTVYLVGAGGCGMSGLGHLLLDLGHRVAGSDLAVNEDVLELRKRGADIATGHDPAHLVAAQPRLVVYSSAIRRDNPQLTAARQQNLPIVRRAVLLAALAHRQQGVCVAGMHGKTTTTALLAHALKQLGAQPSYAVGARVAQLQPHAACPQPSAAESPFVFEGDESDGTLAEFHPASAILLNVDEEHLDFYANLEAVCAAFGQFASQTRGTVFFCADDARLAEVMADHPRAISFGFNPLATYRVIPQPATPSTTAPLPCPAQRFEVKRAGVTLGEFGISLIGQKNVSNAAAVIAILHTMGYAPAEIARAIVDFTGAARRQQVLFQDHRFRVYDDYGHHPAEIAATIEAFRELKPRRLLVAFQPHRFTRTQLLLHQFATCFRAADHLWLTEVYAASEPEIAGVNGARLAEAIRATDQPVEFLPTLENLTRSIRAAMMPGDIVLFLGAGDITRAAHALARELQENGGNIKEDMMARLLERVSAQTVVRSNEPLARRTTMRVGGPADIYVEPANETDLARVLEFCQETGVPFTLIGRGSNLLIRDGGIRGVVICLAGAAFNRLAFADGQAHCGAGVKLKTLAVETRRQGLSGFEFLEGIPGSLGGALRMNAGAMGNWLFDVVETIRFMDYQGRVHERRASEVNVEYRGCPLFKTHIALSAVLKGKPADPEAITERMTRFSERRWATQPAAPSAGCIFKNPGTIPAGKLIDELGLKGTRVGGAIVSDVHANFIVNDGTATATDVLALIDRIKEHARTARGIELETEVQVLGEG